MVRRRVNRPTKGYKTKTQVIAHNEAKKVVKRELNKNIEVKCWDGQMAFTNITPTWQVVSLFTDPSGPAGTALSTGGGGQDVLGDILMVKDVMVRFVLAHAATPATSTIRIVIFQIRGEEPVVSSDLFQQASDLVNANFDQSQVATKGGRIKVLYDRRFAQDVNTGTPGLIATKAYIPGRRLKRRVHFDPGVPISIDDGDIFFSWVSDQNTNAPVVKYTSRIRFTDA